MSFLAKLKNMEGVIDCFWITAGLTLIHAQYTSRGDKTQRLPAK